MLFRYSCERLLTVLGLRDLIIGWGKHVADDLATILVDPRPPECACSCRGLHLPLDDNWKREGKCGALARLRLDPNSSAVHLDDALRYGKSQPRTALLAGDRVVGLLEFLKQFGLIGSGDARPGVADRDIE